MKWKAKEKRKDVSIWMQSSKELTWLMIKKMQKQRKSSWARKARILEYRLPWWLSGLWLCTPNAGGLGSIPGQGTKSHKPQDPTFRDKDQVHPKKKKERERILEWVAIPSSRASSQARNWTHISCEPFGEPEPQYTLTVTLQQLKCPPLPRPRRFWGRLKTKASVAQCLTLRLLCLSLSLLQLLATPWTVALPAPLSMEFSRQQRNHLPQTGTWAHVLGFKPSQNSQYLVSGPNEARVLDVSSQKEFSERQSDR